MNTPLISVLMPVYNGEDFVDKAIKSILEQTLDNFEFLIINDGSADNTKEKINQFNDRRIRYFERSRLGLVEQLNFGIDIAAGKYIARMDADDISLIYRLEEQLSFIEKNNFYSIIGSNFIYISPNGENLFEKKYPETDEEIKYQLPIFSPICHSTAFAKTEILKKFKYNPSYETAEDFDLLLRMSKDDLKMYNIQKPLLKFRIHLNSTSHKYQEKQRLVSYQLGLEFINDNINNITNDMMSLAVEYHRLGLLEYYKGSVKLAKKYFIKSILLSPLFIKKNIRYLLISLLGDTMISFLRKNRITSKINEWSNRYLKYDTNKITMPR